MGSANMAMDAALEDSAVTVIAAAAGFSLEDGGAPPRSGSSYDDITFWWGA